MKKCIIFFTLTIMALSCNNKSSNGKFTVKGEIKNLTDQKIFLEQLYFSNKNPETLDTAEVKNGKFSLSAIAAEQGLYRLRLEKSDHGFLFINDNPEILFSTDFQNVTLENTQFNSPANNRLKDFMLVVTGKSQGISMATEDVVKADSLKSSDSLITLAKTHLSKLETDFKQYIIAFTDTVSNPVLAMFALGYSGNIEPASFKEIIPRLEKRFPGHEGLASLVKQYNEYVAGKNKPQQPALPVVGSTAPDITMNDVNDKLFSLSSYRGSYVLVDFWASWCGPCRGENPNLVAAYQKFKDKNFKILGVSLDENKASWLKAINDDQLGWQQISDLKGWNSAAVTLYGFDGIPYNVLLDPQGKIIATSLRGSDLEIKLSQVLK